MMLENRSLDFGARDVERPSLRGGVIGPADQMGRRRHSLRDTMTVSMTTPNRAQHFSRSLAAAAVRADRESIDDIGTLLTRLFTEGLYQQLHATVTTAVVLLGQLATPPLAVSGLAQLEKKLTEQPAHSLAGRLRQARRELGLLRWLLSVRNKALQHRAEAGYLGGRAIIMQDGFAMLHKSQDIAPAELRRAYSLFVGMCRKYGSWNVKPVKTAEIRLPRPRLSRTLPVAPSEFDSCQRAVRDAAAHNLIVSLPVLENIDASLAALIESVPANPFSPSGAVE